MKDVIAGQMDLTQPMSLLRRKAEILCKLHHKLETYAEIVTMLTQLALKDPASADGRDSFGSVFGACLSLMIAVVIALYGIRKFIVMSNYDESHYDEFSIKNGLSQE